MPAVVRQAAGLYAPRRHCESTKFRVNDGGYIALLAQHLSMNVALNDWKHDWGVSFTPSDTTLSVKFKGSAGTPGSSCCTF